MFSTYLHLSCLPNSLPCHCSLYVLPSPYLLFFLILFLPLCIRIIPFLSSRPYLLFFFLPSTASLPLLLALHSSCFLPFWYPLLFPLNSIGRRWKPLVEHPLNFLFPQFVAAKILPIDTPTLHCTYMLPSCVDRVYICAVYNNRLLIFFTTMYGLVCVCRVYICVMYSLVCVYLCVMYSQVCVCIYVLCIARCVCVYLCVMHSQVCVCIYVLCIARCVCVYLCGMYSLVLYAALICGLVC